MFTRKEKEPAVKTFFALRFQRQSDMQKNTLLKQKVCDAIDKRRDRIIEIGEQIWRNPEPGFQEFETAELVAETLSTTGIPFKSNLAITGLRADLNGGTDGPTIALLGELDALVLAAHPEADPATGAIHACGHHAQIAALLGAAMGLLESGVMPALAGKIALMAVPAEEYLQIELRRELAQQGKIKYLSGKSEFIRLGLFDDVNLAMMIHAGPGEGFYTRSSMNGFLAKQVRFYGKAAHAGSSPSTGVNALKAANLSLLALDAQRDTYKDEDCVRVHSIMTKGGDVVNIVPDDARLETLVRARELRAILDASTKFDLAMRSGALALGAETEIVTLPGYLPLTDNPALAKTMAENAALFISAEKHKQRGHLASSSDIGDVSQIMPASHPTIGGANGPGHTTAYKIENPDLAYVTAAKVLACSALDLLSDNAAHAKEIMKNFPPFLTIPAYLKYMEKQYRVERF